MPSLTPTYGTLNVPVVLGDDWIKDFTFKDKDTGLALDLTGYSYRAYMVVSDTESIDITVDDSQLASGIVGLTLLSSTYGDLSAGRYIWYLVQTDPLGAVETKVVGYFIFK